MADIRNRLLGIGASLGVVRLIAPPVGVVCAITAEGAGITLQTMTVFLRPMWSSSTTAPSKDLTPPFTLAEEYVAETVDVEVTKEADSNEILLELACTYLPPRPTPVVRALSPDLGPRHGRTLLTIAGSNLTGSDGAKPTILVDGNPTTEVTVASDGKSLSAKTLPGEVDDSKPVVKVGGVSILVTAHTPTLVMPPRTPVSTTFRSFLRETLA